MLARGRDNLLVEASGLLPFPKEGDSIAVNGVCLTAMEAQAGLLRFQVSPETWDRTALGELRPGERVNLEPALRLGDPLGGHLVLGHVDTVGRIGAVREVPGGWELLIEYPPRYDALVVEKGSVAVDGISLTPFSPARGSFRVAIIPYTWEHTNLRFKRLGSGVNLEFDVLAKYLRGWRGK